MKTKNKEDNMAGLTKEEFLTSLKQMSNAELTSIYNLHEELVSLAKSKQEEMSPSQFIYGLVGFGYHILLNHFQDHGKAAEQLKEFIDDVNGTLSNTSKTDEEGELCLNKEDVADVLTRMSNAIKD